MATTVDWTVAIGTVNAPTDFTSRVTGMSISQPLGFMQPASMQCVITLNNHDGALTPGAGGTYSSVDWFAQGVFVSAEVDSTHTAEVFHGIVNDFEVQDDGVNSTVQLIAADWFTIGARGTYNTSASSSSPFPTLAQRLAASLETFTALQGVETLPLLGNTEARSQYRFPVAPTYDIGEIAASTVGVGTKREATETVLDVFTTREQAGIPSVAWPTIISEAMHSQTLVLTTKYEHVTAGDTLTRYVDYTLFEFEDGTPTAGKFPIRNLDRGFNVERIVNVARITSVFTTNTSSSVNQAAANLAGANGLTVTQSSMTSDTDTQRMADNLVNRFGVARFVPRSLTFTVEQASQVSSGIGSDLATLLDVRTGLWQPVSLDYTPTGAASSTQDVCVIFGRTINVTPADTTIKLELLPAVDYQSFVLNSDVLGVLDQNRLG